jgi:hypothetical protein
VSARAPRRATHARLRTGTPLPYGATTCSAWNTHACARDLTLTYLAAACYVNQACALSIALHAYAYIAAPVASLTLRAYACIHTCSPLIVLAARHC